MFRRAKILGTALPAMALAACLLAPVASAATSAPQSPATQKTLAVSWQRESYDYWCGPAATRIALSGRMGSGTPSQATLAGQLGTTTAGTDNIRQVTSVLNKDLKTTYYQNKQIPNDPPTSAQVNLLWSDITYDVDRNYALVINIDAPASNHPPGYPNEEIFHYFTVAGYNTANKTAYIVDPASGLSGFGSVPQHYWLSLTKLASLIPPKGYSA